MSRYIHSAHEDWYEIDDDKVSLMNFRVAVIQKFVKSIHTSRLTRDRSWRKRGLLREGYAASNAGTVVWRKFSTDIGTRPVRFITVGVTIA
jgi:hypothetical protein